MQEDHDWPIDQPGVTRIEWFKQGHWRELKHHDDPNVSHPFIKTLLPERSVVHLRDFVGKNLFRVFTGDAHQDHTVFVVPRKLGDIPTDPWANLRLMLDDLPKRMQGIHFPESFLQRIHQELSSSYYRFPEDLHQDLLQASRAVLARPQSQNRTVTRMSHSELLNGDVDWEGTLEGWGQGQEVGRSHLVREPHRDWNQPGNQALLAVWQHLQDQLPSVSVQEHRRRVQLHLPGVHTPSLGEALRHAHTPLPPAYRELQRILGRLSSRNSFVEEPTTHYAMNVLYETWCFACIAQQLGSVTLQGQPQVDDEGRYRCTFVGETYTVHFNPVLVYEGVKKNRDRSLRPDLLIEWMAGGQRKRIVLDAKYRPIHRLPPPETDKIDSQILQYMGISKAPLGVVLWPGAAGTPAERINITDEDGGRIAVFALNPAEDPEVLHRRISTLIALGGTL